MPDHELVNIIASADAAINAEDFDALMTFYAADATLVVEPGRWVTGRTALREAFVAVAEHFTHSLRVSQEEMLVIEGAGTALVVAKTRVHGTLISGEPYDTLRRATYVFRKEQYGGWRCTVDNSYGTELLSQRGPERARAVRFHRNACLLYPEKRIPAFKYRSEAENCCGRVPTVAKYQSNSL